jgi:hypothetical protein
MSESTQEVQVLLTRGLDGEALEKPVRLYVEARRDVGEVEVGNKIVDGLDNVLDAIRAMAGQIAQTVKHLTPDRFAVELGFEIKSEAGGLVAMLVRAEGSASLKVTLEWGNDSVMILSKPYPQRRND